MESAQIYKNLVSAIIAEGSHTEVEAAEEERHCIGEVFISRSKKIAYKCHCCDQDFTCAVSFEEHLMQSIIINIDSKDEVSIVIEQSKTEPHEGNNAEIEQKVLLLTDDDFDMEEADVEDDCDEEYYVADYEAEFAKPSNINETTPNITAENQDENSEIQLKQENLEKFEIKPDDESMLQALQRLRALRNKTLPKKSTKEKVSPKSKRRATGDQSSKLNLNCSHCDFTAGNEKELKQHTTAKHCNYKCDICNATFSYKYNLTIHVKRHTQPKKFCCTFCAKLFHSNVELKAHERRHTGEKPYKCNTCGRRFTTNSQLNDHKSRESNERPYACEQCEKRFKTNAECKKHYVVHTNERNIFCEYCNATFSRRKSYKNHLKLHLNAKEYVCDYCPLAFNQRPALYSHLRMKHRDELTNAPALQNTKNDDTITKPQEE